MKIALFALIIFCLAIVSSAQQKTEPQPSSPVSYGIVADNSGSIRPALEAVIMAAQAIIKQNKAADEAFVVRFVGRDKIQRVQEMTGDGEELADAVENFFPEGGQTALIDAIMASADHLSKERKAEPASRRSALIVISDGEERESRTKTSELIKLLKDSKITVYAIGITPEIKKDPLEKITSGSGGKLYHPRKVGEMNAAIAEIFAELRKP